MAASVFEVVDAIRAAPGAHRDRGSLFEQLTAEFLRRDPTFAARFSRVWLWCDWPGRGTATDTGIDLVAQEADGSGLCAVQCKLYDPTHQVSKADIDTFFTASGKRGFTSRLFVSTTDRWGKNAEGALEDQTIPVSRIGLADMAASPITWDAGWVLRGRHPMLTVHAPYKLKPHQQDAVNDVFAGWAGLDRGQLIMACGTGKTLTALKIAERLASELNWPTRVLFLVPSIALLSQTLREWTAQSTTQLHCQAVCSDPKSTAKARAVEDVSTHDLPLAATTDPRKVLAGLAGASAPLRVVFSTYQSIDQIAAAVRISRGEHPPDPAALPIDVDRDLAGVLDGFDLIVCDEAHRTTGVTLAGADESHFLKVHDNAFLPADRRLYMTATPKIYGDETKRKADENAAVLASMDDPTVFGPEFHRLGFGRAVDWGLLADYRVLILTVDESFIAKGWQEMIADANNEISLDDAARIVGCWNGLAKRSHAAVDPVTGHTIGFAPGESPMRRAVAFSHTIKASKALAAKFGDVTAAYTGEHAPQLSCEVEHVDGTMNSLTRNRLLDWLQDTTGPDVCRILSNARCLSEGVDVPTLDAVLFLTPRNSVVDVVQSVGRVMRAADSKQYGYIILPVAVPSGVAPEKALEDNQRYRVVWQVLQALRAHDDRFNATINKIELNASRPEQIMVLPVTDGDADDGAGTAAAHALTLPFPVALADAVYARIVEKVGERTYWEQWAKDIAAIAQRHVDRITALIDDPACGKQDAFAEFLTGLQATINPGIDAAAAIDMLAQHLITRPVFEALFADYQFLTANPVSRTMQRMLDALEDQALDKETETLHKFYDSVRRRAEGIDNHAGRQQVMTELYEKFFKTALPKTAASLGIVYTPIEVVDFILRVTDQALQRHLGTSLTAQGVQILDPFTGTGTFMSRLIGSGLITPPDLARKYAGELHANEIVLLAYYIAAVNIEAAYHDAAETDGYQPFDGIVLTDTFQMSETGDAMDHRVFATNTDRGQRQLGLDIRVIIGNPPYSVGQASENDANQNLKYPTLDKAIEQTYAARSASSSVRSLYDSYIRAFRWATNRICLQGVVCYVSNGGWLEANSADGMRKTLADEYDHIYVYNLRGNQRTAGELSRREGGKVFGGGSRNTVAITLLVKTGQPNVGPARIHYRDIGDYLTREDKLARVAAGDLDNVDWTELTTNEHGDWISQRDATFAAFTPIADPELGEASVFLVHSFGLTTNRDAWVYGYTPAAVDERVAQLKTTFDGDLARFKAVGSDPDRFMSDDPKEISWSRRLKQQFRQGRELELAQPSEAVRPAAYRPFTRMYAWFDRAVNEDRRRLPEVFPTAEHANNGIYVAGMTSAVPFTVLLADAIPDLHLTGAGSGGQFFPRYIYESPEDRAGMRGQLPFGDRSDYVRRDNVTDEIQAAYGAAVGEPTSKDDIFHYVYGILHSPQYRTQYAADLKKMLPRIPTPDTPERFTAFAEAGRALAEQHVGYETVDPYPLAEEWSMPSHDEDLVTAYRVEKMTLAKKGKDKDRSRIIVNHRLTLTGIPEDAYRYMLGSRSAVEWVIDRYQIRVDKASGIVNDPNTYGDDPRYIVELLKRVVTVSIETMRIVDTLPSLPDDGLRGDSKEDSAR